MRYHHFDGTNLIPPVWRHQYSTASLKVPIQYHQFKGTNALQPVWRYQYSTARALIIGYAYEPIAFLNFEKIASFCLYCTSYYRVDPLLWSFFIPYSEITIYSNIKSLRTLSIRFCFVRLCWPVALTLYMRCVNRQTDLIVARMRNRIENWPMKTLGKLTNRVTRRHLYGPITSLCPYELFINPLHTCRRRLITT